MINVAISLNEAIFEAKDALISVYDEPTTETQTENRLTREDYNHRCIFNVTCTMQTWVLSNYEPVGNLQTRSTHTEVLDIQVALGLKSFGESLEFDCLRHAPFATPQAYILTPRSP